MTFLLPDDSVFSMVETFDSTEVLVKMSNTKSILFPKGNISQSLPKALSLIRL